MKNILLPFLLLGFVIAKASTCFSINLNQPYYLQTEKIKGTISFDDCKESLISPFIRLELRKEGKSYASSMVSSGQSFAAFEIDIPSDLPSDAYMVIAYAVDSKSVDVIGQKVLVIDPDLEIDENYVSSISRRIETDTISAKDNWQLDLDDSFGTDSEVSVTISSLDQLPQESRWKNEYLTGRMKESYNQNATLSADFIEGRIVDKDSNKPCQSCPVFLTIPSLKRAIYSDFTDENGDFQFVLLPFEGLEKAYFSAPGLGDQFNIEFLEKELDLNERFSFDQSDNIKKLFPHISSYLKYRRAENYISKEVPDSIQIKESYESILNLEAESAKIVLDDFVKVKSIREMFKEVIPHSGVKKNGTMWVYNQDFNQINPYVPVVLLDGIVIDKHEYILSLKVEDIYQVSIVNRLKEMRKIGNYVNRGIIAIYTRNGILTSDLPNVISKEIQGASIMAKTSSSGFKREARFDSSYSKVLKANNESINVDFKSYPGVFLVKLSSIDEDGYTISKELIRVVVP